jgi:hypothetical protein
MVSSTTALPYLEASRAVLGLAAAARGSTGAAASLNSGQSGGDRLECGREVAADRGPGGDDDDGDQSGDETIFDGRDTGLIADKAMEQITHD